MGGAKLIHARKQGDQTGYALLISIKISEVQVRWTHSSA